MTRRPARRSLLVLGALTLVACPGDDGPPPIRWLAMGDSYSSGEGVRGVEGECARSTLAYAPVARTLLDDEFEIEAFSFTACTGAVLADLGGQFSENSEFNLATVTMGGNDAGYAGVLAGCRDVDALEEAIDRLLEGPAGCDISEAQLTASVEALADELVTAYGSVAARLDPEGILVVLGYPHLFADPATWEPGLESCERVSAADARLLRRIAVVLDRTLAATVAEIEDAVYISVVDAFAGHELCGPDDDWLLGFTLGVSSRTFRPQGSFHPNEAGHQALADLLAGALRETYG